MSQLNVLLGSIKLDEFLKNQKEMKHMKTDELLKRISHQLSEIIDFLKIEKHG